MPNDNEPRDINSPDHHQAEMSDAESRGVKTLHVLKTMGKWLIGGAIIGALLFAAVPVFFTAAAGGAIASATPWYVQLPLIGSLFTSTGAGAATSAAGGILGWLGNTAASAGIAGALIGGGAAGLIGLFSGLSSMDAKAEDVNEERMANYDRGLQRQRQMEALKMQQRQLAVNMRKMEEQYGLTQSSLPRRDMSGTDKGAGIG